MVDTPTALAPDAIFDWEKVRKQQKLFSSALTFKLAMLKMLPLGFWTGMRVRTLENDRCTVTVPYKYLNKNPFGSTFWAVMGMAAEMASGALALQYVRSLKAHSVAFILVEQDAQFYNKAIGITTFECKVGPEIRQAMAETIETGEPVVVKCPVTAVDKDGNSLGDFSFSWSFKARSK